LEGRLIANKEEQNRINDIDDDNKNRSNINYRQKENEDIGKN
jgi:hypothetical protein